MAWTSVGFDGTITEIQWAGMASLLGNGYVAAGNGDCVVTAVGGARSVSVAAGSLYGDGVLSTNSGAETVAMTTPVNGQWYVIALRRTWATNTAALVAIAGATTTTTTPTAPPTSFPVLNTTPGVLTDQPIAWAWCNSANTTVVVYDIRLKAVKSLPPVVATSAERDAKFMSPTQGLQVWRDDLGAVETYYGLYNASTNPGGRDSAGWYTNTRQVGAAPVKATTVTAVSGTASVNALGEVTYSSCTAIYVGGVFTSKYRNYTVKINNNLASTGTVLLRWVSSGTASASGYFTNGLRAGGGTTLNNWNTGFNVTEHALCTTDNGYNSGQFNGVIEAFDPQTNNSTFALSNFYSVQAGAGFALFQSGSAQATTSRDGFYIGISSGNMTGTITVYGWN